MTVNELCKCFKYFSKESRIIIHFEHGDSVTSKWEEVHRKAEIGGLVVKRFKVTSLIAKNIIILAIWI